MTEIGFDQVREMQVAKDAVLALRVAHRLAPDAMERMADDLKVVFPDNRVVVFDEGIELDDRMVERAAERLYQTDDERLRAEGVEWENEPDGYRWLYRNRARDVLGAAFDLD